MGARGELFTTQVTLDNRSYFFNVKENRNGDIFLQVVESKSRNGEDFDELIRKYSEDDKSTYSFGKGDMDPAFETAAFNLGTDEISDIVESEYGYHIIKCLTTFDKEETDANKIKIVEQRREEAFGQEYDAYVATLTRNLNEELWDSVSFIHDDNVKTQNFFEIYSQYFE